MNRNSDDAPRQPADVIPDGNLKATIWRNEGDKGPFYATTFTRSFKDQSGEYRDTHSFVAADLLRLSELARKAYDRTATLRREDRAQSRQQATEGDPDTARRAAFKQQRSTPDQQERPRGIKR